MQAARRRKGSGGERARRQKRGVKGISLGGRSSPGRPARPGEQSPPADRSRSRTPAARRNACASIHAAAARHPPQHFIHEKAKRPRMIAVPPGRPSGRCAASAAIPPRDPTATARRSPASRRDARAIRHRHPLFAAWANSGQTSRHARSAPTPALKRVEQASRGRPFRRRPDQHHRLRVPGSVCSRSFQPAASETTSGPSCQTHTEAPSSPTRKFSARAARWDTLHPAAWRFNARLLAAPRVGIVLAKSRTSCRAGCSYRDAARARSRWPRRHS